MVKKSKLFYGFLLSSMMILPSLANGTDITLSGTLEDVVSLQIERVGDGKIVSEDDLDPNSTITSNETLNFGSINPLGLDTTTNAAVNRSGTGSTNGTVFTVQSMVLNTSNVLFAPVEVAATPVLLPKGVNKGAVYFTEGAIQLRSLRTGGGTMEVDVSNAGDMDAVVGLPALSFAASQDISANILDLASDGVDLNAFIPALPNDTAQVLDIGIVVPYTLTGINTTKSTVVTFTGT